MPTVRQKEIVKRPRLINKEGKAKNLSNTDKALSILKPQRLVTTAPRFSYIWIEHEVKLPH